MWRRARGPNARPIETSELVIRDKYCAETTNFLALVSFSNWFKESTLLGRNWKVPDRKSIIKPRETNCLQGNDFHSFYGTNEALKIAKNVNYYSYWSVFFCLSNTSC